jgi:hypothetical protein
MLSVSPPTPPPHPPPVRTDTRLIEPDEQWKADLRRRIEHGLCHMVEDVQTVRDTILDSRPSESDRERAHREFEDAMNAIRNLAQEEFNRELRIEMSERKWALDVADSNSPDVARQQQWILDNIRKADDDRPSFVNPDSPKNAEGVLSARPQEQIDSTQARDRIASNIGPRDRQTSALASPYDRHSPPTYPTMAPRATPGARPPPLDDAVRFPTFARPGSRTLFSMQRSPEDTRQGVAIPRGPTAPEDGPPGPSWASPHSHRSYGD